MLYDGRFYGFASVFDLRVFDLTRRPAHFLWMEIAAKALTFKVGELEPVFCSLALYRVVSRMGKKGAEVDMNRSGRVSETFW